MVHRKLLSAHKLQLKLAKLTSGYFLGMVYEYNNACGLEISIILGRLTCFLRNYHYSFLVSHCSM